MVKFGDEEEAEGRWSHSDEFHALLDHRYRALAIDSRGDKL